MKILMLGWEYPPNITGGLGVASQGIAEGLAKRVSVTFLLPKKSKNQVSEKVKLVDLSAYADSPEVWHETKERKEIIKGTTIGQILVPYLPPKYFEKSSEKVITRVELTAKVEKELLQKIPLNGSYEDDLLGQTAKYAFLASHYASHDTYDIIHAHDWPTFKAGKSLKNKIKKPMVVHIHSTEFERNGIHAQQQVIALEKEGLDAADGIITVSETTKAVLVNRYDIRPDKIKVVPNAIDYKTPSLRERLLPKRIAFIGRFTDQKSPSTFLDIVRHLKSTGAKYEYIMIGDGYLKAELKEKAKNQNLDIEFTGFLSREKVLKKLNNIDLLVVPSNTEPFGLVTLEAIMKKIPVAAAKGSGVAEFIPSLPQVDNWNHFEYTNLILRLMSDSAYRANIIASCYQQGTMLTWANSAKLVLDNYKKIIMR